MLSGIANLIFGATPVEEETTANKEINLKVTPVENEWALVDRHENDCGESENVDVVVLDGNSRASSSSSSPSPSHKSTTHNTPSHSSNSSHSNSHDDVRMEESWLVTPPPCFTGGRVSHRLETNPLENLLIEHPSMSVYNTGGRASSTGDSASVSSSIHELESMSSTVQPRRSPRRPRAVAARAGLVAQQVELLKPMQLRQRRQSCKQLSKNKLDRNNKVQQQRRHTRQRQLLQQPKSSGKRRC